MNRVAKTRVGLLFVGSLMVAGLTLPVAFGADASKSLDGKGLFEQKCLKCHKQEKFRSQHNSRKDWDLILSRMERNSCVLSNDEREVVAAYLSKKYGE